MKQVIQRIGAWIVLSILVLAMAACGGQTADESKQAVKQNTVPEHGVYVPELTVVRELPQSPEWGDDITINRVLAVTDELVYLVDSRAMRMVAVDREGKLVYSFLKKGQGPGEFQYFPATQELNGDLWLSEWQKIDRFTMDGTLQDEYRIQENYIDLTMLDGNRFAASVIANVGQEEDSTRIKRAGIWDLKETLLKELASTDKLGMFEFNIGNSFITIIFSGGIMPTMETAADPARGLVYTCVSDTYRIQVWDREGNLVRTIERDVPLVTITNENKDDMAGRLRVSGMDEAEVRRRLREQLPEHFCRIADLRVTDGGLLIVERVVGYDKMELDVFGPDGTFLATWQSPEDVRLDECLLARGHLYRIDDEGDMPALVEYAFADDASREILARIW